MEKLTDEARADLRLGKGIPEGELHFRRRAAAEGIEIDAEKGGMCRVPTNDERTTENE